MWQCHSLEDDKRMKNLSVMIKPVSGMCNMTCDYCFYCDEAKKREKKFYGLMREETLKNIIRRTMLQAEGVVSYTGGPGIDKRNLQIGRLLTCINFSSRNQMIDEKASF